VTVLLAPAEQSTHFLADVPQAEKPVEVVVSGPMPEAAFLLWRKEMH
jgi:hypothetical protein